MTAVLAMLVGRFGWCSCVQAIMKYAPSIFDRPARVAWRAEYEERRKRLCAWCGPGAEGPVLRRPRTRPYPLAAARVHRFAGNFPSDVPLIRLPAGSRRVCLPPRSQ